MDNLCVTLRIYFTIYGLFVTLRDTREYAAAIICQMGTPLFLREWYNTVNIWADAFEIIQI